MKTRIPRYIDDPPQFLLWDIDEFFIVIGLFCLGILMGHPGKLGLLGLVVGRLLRKYRSGKADGFVWHCLYWVGLVPGNPPGHVREMHE
jgi:conjugal transfer pilus assembly protein TraL